MSEFEYVAVFISIIFGISVTHILTGVMRSFYRGERETTHLVLTAFMFLVLTLNWWTGFRWHDRETWSVDTFVIIIVWSVAHYVAAITLYPPLSSHVEQPFEYRIRWFLWAFIGIGLLDILQTWVLGSLFSPWYYLPYVGFLASLALIVVIVNRPEINRWAAWTFLVSMVGWTFIVRRFLA